MPPKGCIDEWCSTPRDAKLSFACILSFPLGGLIAGCILLSVGLQRQQFFDALDPTTDFSKQPGQCTILAVYQRNILKREGGEEGGDVCYAQLSYEFTGPFAKATDDSISRPSSQEVVAALNTPGVMDHFDDTGSRVGTTLTRQQRPMRYGGWKLATSPDNATAVFAGRVAMSRAESIKLHNGICTFPEDSPKDASSTKNGYLFQRGGEKGDEKAEDYGGKSARGEVSMAATKSSMESFWVGDKTDCWQANDRLHVQKTAVIDGIKA